MKSKYKVFIIIKINALIISILGKLIIGFDLVGKGLTQFNKENDYSLLLSFQKIIKTERQLLLVEL